MAEDHDPNFSLKLDSYQFCKCPCKLIKEKTFSRREILYVSCCLYSTATAITFIGSGQYTWSDLTDWDDRTGWASSGAS